MKKHEKAPLTACEIAAWKNFEDDIIAIDEASNMVVTDGCAPFNTSLDPAIAPSPETPLGHISMMGDFAPPIIPPDHS